MALFERLKYLANKQGKSINDVEDDMGYSKNTLYRLKKTNPSSEKLKEIADYFNVSADYLLGRTDQEYLDEPETIAAHHDSYNFTKEELEEIEEFKRFVAMRREARKSKGD
ncbi:Helix-turn-helix [Halolactibacillus halophilus]|uniref:Helix-turn-helix n=1 Tax=Halolactibacillus halophilus TaxID=306540 RepID=A0A1I5LEI3_9BACI|nr:helix-turn-helix transcriptional regulator [Halolactibacillus halophilus]GEM00864.1 hypothetical protein HHA03_03960 [Halolactibacillus halophilus]SFO95583.1 Helix-turn-helix [Halolactibacillus halophilus]